jgi:FKBP-type peptidyl-prolyl cis-trans isomerase
VLRVGAGKRHPVSNDTVMVHYSGWTPAGQTFDSSYARGAPATFPLKRVIEGWSEGVQLMVEGEKRRFWIPADLAYGTKPIPSAPGAPLGPLVFDIELITIRR